MHDSRYTDAFHLIDAVNDTVIHLRDNDANGSLVDTITSKLENILQLAKEEKINEQTTRNH